MNALQSFETSGATSAMTQCHTPEDVSLQQCCFENLKSCTIVKLVTNLLDKDQEDALFFLNFFK